MPKPRGPKPKALTEKDPPRHVTDPSKCWGARRDGRQCGQRKMKGKNVCRAHGGGNGRLPTFGTTPTTEPGRIRAKSLAVMADAHERDPKLLDPRQSIAFSRACLDIASSPIDDEEVVIALLKSKMNGVEPTALEVLEFRARFAGLLGKDYREHADAVNRAAKTAAGEQIFTAKFMPILREFAEACRRAVNALTDPVTAERVGEAIFNHMTLAKGRGFGVAFGKDGEDE